VYGSCWSKQMNSSTTTTCPECGEEVDELVYVAYEDLHMCEQCREYGDLDQEFRNDQFEEGLRITSEYQEVEMSDCKITKQLVYTAEQGDDTLLFITHSYGALSGAPQHVQAVAKTAGGDVIILNLHPNTKPSPTETVLYEVHVRVYTGEYEEFAHRHYASDESSSIEKALEWALTVYQQWHTEYYEDEVDEEAEGEDAPSSV